MSPPAELVLGAPAKLNLALHIGGRRVDGFHGLASCLVALDRCDRLRLRRTEGEAGVKLAVRGPLASPDVPPGRDNLALRAAELVLEREGAEDGSGAGLELELEKHLPSGAGLGGGSSDAAAALFGAATLLGVDPDAPELVDGLARLGSDCPFFLAARDTGWAVCTGRGEVVSPFEPHPRLAFAVLTPSAHVGTAGVYGALARQRGDRVPDLPEPEQLAALAEVSADELRGRLCNDLEPAAIEMEPELERWRSLFDAHAPHYRLAGSGASFFSVYADVERAEVELRELEALAAEAGLATRAAFVARPAAAGIVRLA